MSRPYKVRSGLTLLQASLIFLGLCLIEGPVAAQVMSGTILLPNSEDRVRITVHAQLSSTTHSGLLTFYSRAGDLITSTPILVPPSGTLVSDLTLRKLSVDDEVYGATLAWSEAAYHPDVALSVPDVRHGPTGWPLSAVRSSAVSSESLPWWLSDASSDVDLLAFNPSLHPVTLTITVHPNGRADRLQKVTVGPHQLFSASAKQLGLSPETSVGYISVSGDESISSRILLSHKPTFFSLVIAPEQSTPNTLQSQKKASIDDNASIVLYPSVVLRDTQDNNHGITTMMLLSNVTKEQEEVKLAAFYPNGRLVAEKELSVHVLAAGETLLLPISEEAAFLESHPAYIGLVVERALSTSVLPTYIFSVDDRGLLIHQSAGSAITVGRGSLSYWDATDSRVVRYATHANAGGDSTLIQVITEGTIGTQSTTWLLHHGMEEADITLRLNEFLRPSHGGYGDPFHNAAQHGFITMTGSTSSVLTPDSISHAELTSLQPALDSPALLFVDDPTSVARPLCGGPCATPVNLVQVSCADAGGGTLKFHYTFSSSSGSLSDLSSCLVTEDVIYPGPSGVYHFPSPPFPSTLHPPNPDLGRAAKGTYGFINDNHSTPGTFVRPLSAVGVTATQYYRYQCGCTGNSSYYNLAGPFYISRALGQISSPVKQPGGTWQLTTTKSGCSAKLYLGAGQSTPAIDTGIQ